MCISDDDVSVEYRFVFLCIYMPISIYTAETRTGFSQSKGESTLAKKKKKDPSRVPTFITHPSTTCRRRVCAIKFTKKYFYFFSPMTHVCIIYFPGKINNIYSMIIFFF